MTACKPFSLDLAADQSGLPHYQPPPCQVACPIGTDVGSYVGLIWDGDAAGALEAITATNPFSGVCSRVCDAPCESACRRSQADGAVTIRALKRSVMEALGPGYRLPPVQPTQSQTIAIVGAGPAGLTAAQDLALAGYPVALYEAQDRAGGAAAWGIPDFRLPPAVVAEDVNRVLERCSGITVHLSTPLGAGGVSLEALRRDHAAVLLALGANVGRPLGVPGDTLPQVVDGLSFLKRINGGERPTLPAHVVVIGGGDVAMDACRAAQRLPGVKKVTVLYRRSLDEMPARLHERHAALAEGIEIVTQVAPTAVQPIPGADDRVALSCVRTALGAPGPDGRRGFQAIPESEFTLDVGLVIAAVGQKTAVEELERHGLLAQGRILADPQTLATPLPGVFAAGDAASGSSTLVRAMEQGHRAAYYVLAALNGETHPQPYRTPYRTRQAPLAQDPRWEKLGREEPRFLGQGADPWGETEANYDTETAKAQAARCYRCDTETGSTDYSVKLRETLFALARPDTTAETRRALTLARLDARPTPARPGRPTFDDLVFLPANLTRLVIDPYREACKTTTPLAAGLSLAHPLLVGGFDTAPDGVRAALAQSLADSGTAYVGRAALPGVPWVQLVGANGIADPAAALAIALPRPGTPPAPPALARPDQPWGLLATRATLGAAVAVAVDRGAACLVLDGSEALPADGADLAGPPDIGLLPEAIRLLRARKAEELVPIVWFGGLRSGSDLAKALALGATAGMVAAAAGFALGGVLDRTGLVFPEAAPSAAALSLFLQAAVSEGSMMARCTGKTNIHNLEPEDLRTLTLAAQSATGIVMAGVKKAG